MPEHAPLDQACQNPDPPSMSTPARATTGNRKPRQTKLLVILAFVFLGPLLLIPAMLSESPPFRTDADAPPLTQTPHGPARGLYQDRIAALPADLLVNSPPPELPDESSKALSFTRDQLIALVDKFADQHRVERPLAHAVVFAESKYDPFAVSRVGAIGLMQVMPSTASDYGVFSASDLFDPEINLNAGMRHLRRLLDKYDGNVGVAVMAYNAGEGVVDRADANVTYRETLGYTDAVIRAYIANGGRYSVKPMLIKLEQLRLIGNAGIVKRIERKSIDLRATTLKSLPELAIDNVDPRLRTNVSAIDRVSSTVQ